MHRPPGLIDGHSPRFGRRRVDLSVQASGGNWAAYATVNDPASLGLAGIQFDVVGQGVQLGAPSATDNRLATGSFHDGGGALVAAGFVDFRGAVLTNNDIQFEAAQPVVYNNEDPLGNDNLARGFGLPGVNAGTVGDQSATWGSPALIATGTYTGNGLIAVFSSTNLSPSCPAHCPLTTVPFKPTALPQQAGNLFRFPSPPALGLRASGPYRSSLAGAVRESRARQKSDSAEVQTALPTGRRDSTREVSPFGVLR